MGLRKGIQFVERWLGRVHLLGWLITSIAAIMTATAAYFRAPLYLFIPAFFGAIALPLLAINQFAALRERFRAPVKPPPVPIASPVRDFAVSTNRQDHHTYVTFIPVKDMRRLRVCLDQSRFEDDALSSPPFWTELHRSVVAEFQDLTRGCARPRLLLRPENGLCPPIRSMNFFSGPARKCRLPQEDYIEDE